MFSLGLLQPIPGGSLFLLDAANGAPWSWRPGNSYPQMVSPEFIQHLPGIGDVAILMDPRASGFQKAIAGVSLATTFILPGLGRGLKLGAEAATAGVEAAEEANIVYRGLAAGEDAAAGLVARAPEAGNSIASHVAGQRASQWISTTKSLDIAMSRFGQNGVVAIDLSKVSGTVVDVSAGIPGMSPKFMLSRWAIKTQELLIQGEIPANAIKIIQW